MPEKTKIYKYRNGHMTIAEVRKTKKMYVVDKIINKKPGYNLFYESERLYEHEISFTAEQAFQAERNKLKERLSRHKEVIEKTLKKIVLLDKYSETFKEE